VAPHRGPKRIPGDQKGEKDAGTWVPARTDKKKWLGEHKGGTKACLEAMRKGLWRGGGDLVGGCRVPPPQVPRIGRTTRWGGGFSNHDGTGKGNYQRREAGKKYRHPG